ncbi:metallophosphoesterase [Treponema brennaborense]|uniref:Metallophosphoesterase n=1 Tax=Treponema brennaborense (strain DSM 12168 / CIP 105900 / DD5/3) TaxID=906968 RepID=F4LIP3_TREBD|nr:metallophosphoesterase [Treponema brennaborense]AEE17268.1 metallophosphoesterase [Treponema brennaborense DSM 12168]
MKILCVSDQIDPIVYSNSAKQRFSDIDAVLCAGDLPMEYIDFIVSTLNVPTYFVFGNHNLSDFYLYHSGDCATQKGHSVRLAPVREYDMSRSHGAVYAGFKVLKYHEPDQKNPLLLAGASGSIKYNKGLCQYSDRAMKRQLIRMIPRLLLNKLRYGRYLDIFLTHSPPRHIHDKEDPCHKGFACYRWFLKKFKPTYMIHGHIHLYDLQEPRVSEYAGTTIINAYSHYILDFPLEME